MPLQMPDAPKYLTLADVWRPPSIDETIKIENLKQMATPEYQTKALNEQKKKVFQKNLEVAQKTGEIVNTAQTFWLNGDKSTANLLLEQAKPGFKYRTHDDKKLSNDGWLVEVSPVGVETPINFLGVTRLKKKVDTEYTRLKQTAELGISNWFHRKKSIEQKTWELANDGGLTVGEARQTALELDRQAYGNRLGKTPGQLLGLNNDTDFRDTALASVELKSAKHSVPLSGKRLGKKRKLESKYIDELIGSKRALNKFTKIILPKIQDIIRDDNNILPENLRGTNLLNSKLNDVARIVGLDSSDLTFLSTIERKNFLEQLKEQSGVQYGYRELKFIESVFPRPEDTVGVALAKSTAMAALISMNAVVSIEGWKDFNYDVGGYENAFQINLDDKSYNEIEGSTTVIYNSLPDDLKGDRPFMESLLRNFPSQMRKSIIDKLSADGYKTSFGAVEKFKRNRKRR